MAKGYARRADNSQLGSDRGAYAPSAGWVASESLPSCVDGGVDEIRTVKFRVGKLGVDERTKTPLRRNMMYDD